MMTRTLVPGILVLLGTGCDAHKEEGVLAASFKDTKRMWPDDDPTSRSANDPHVPKDTGPWFEGWFTRVTDLDGSRSVAIIAGSHKPDGIVYTSGMLMPGYIGILISDGDGAATKSFEIFPEDTYMLKDGAPVESNPDFWSPAEFEWVAPGYGSVTQDSVHIEIRGVVEIHVEAGEPLPWNEHFSEVGPEGLLAFVPLPLHWHVSSLGSQCDYEYTLVEDGYGNTVESQGYAHLEKNWGGAFPLAWSWGQGIGEDNKAQFVYGGGRVEILTGIIITPWILGYRSERLSWDFNFAKPGTMFQIDMNACAGEFCMKAKDAGRTLEISASAPPETFGSVSIPTADGWAKDAGGESFSASYTIRAYWHTYLGGLLGSENFIEETVFHNAALEFGADYVCQQ